MSKDKLFSDNLKPLISGYTDKTKKGRPTTSTAGLFAGETRATFIIEIELLEKVKALAYLTTELIKDTVGVALQEAIDKYEKEHGKIDTTATIDREIQGKRYYTIPEIATTLKVTAPTVRAWIKQGKLEATRIGRPIVITEESLAKFLNR